MADFTPVSNNIQPVDSMKSLGSIMNIAQGAQQLQAGEIANNSNSAILQERNNVRGLFQDGGKKYMDASGNLDFNALAPDMMSAAPTQGAGMMSQMYQAQNQGIQAKKELNTLNTSQREQVGQFVGSLGQTDPQTGLQQFDDFIKSNPQLTAAGAFARQHILMPAINESLQTNNSQPWVGATNQMRMSIMGADSQRSALTPSGIQVGNGIQSATVNTNPMAQGGVGSTVPGTLQTQLVPLANQQSVGEDASRNPTIISKDPYGNIKNITAAPVDGATQAKPFFLPPGETDATLKTMQNNRQGANDAAAAAPNQAFNANQIIKYADEGMTGTGSEWLAKVGSILPGIKITGDKATDTQNLGHALAVQTATAAQSAGLNGSNASRDLASTMTADGSWTPDAIKSSSRVMRALGSTGAQLYNAGIENAVKTGGPFAVRNFENKWSGVANIDGIRLYDAMRNQDSDTDGIKQVVQSLGGVNSIRYQFALKKIDQMRNLIQGQ